MLVTAQLALAVTVVATSALLARSLLQLQAVDTGLDVDQLVVASLAVPQTTSSDRTRLLRLLNDLVARLEASTPVLAATPINMRPFSGVGWSVPAFVAEGQDPTRASANPPLDLEAVHPGYFATFGVQVVRAVPSCLETGKARPPWRLSARMWRRGRGPGRIRSAIVSRWAMRRRKATG